MDSEENKEKKAELSLSHNHRAALTLCTTAEKLPARPLSLLTIGKTGLTQDQLDYVEPMITVPVGLALGVAS